MACTNFLLGGLLGPPIATMYLISGLPAHVALGAEALRSGIILAVGVAFAAAHADGVSPLWLAANVARCAALAAALPVLTAALAGARDALELERLQLCPVALRPLRDALVAAGEVLRGVASLRSVQHAVLVALFAYFMSYMAAVLSSAGGAYRSASLAAGWLVAFAAVGARVAQLQRRRANRHLRTPGRRRVHALHLRLNKLDADPDALLSAAADELLCAFPHGCTVALAEFAPAARQLRRVCTHSLRTADAAVLAAAVPAGVQPGGSAAAALEHPQSCAGLTLDAEDYTEGAAAFADWAAMCADEGAGPGCMSVTLLGTGLDVTGAMWVHAPAGVTPPAPDVLCSCAEAIGAALLRSAAARARLAAAKAEARADADATLALQRAFMSGITHELRTPLNAIIGFTATVLEESTALEAHLREHMRCVLSASHTLLDIIDQLLDYAKFEACNGAPDGVLTDEPLCLRQVLDVLVDIAGGKAAAGGVALCVEVDAALQAARLRGDPARLRQVLVNLTGTCVYAPRVCARTPCFLPSAFCVSTAERDAPLRTQTTRSSSQTRAALWLSACARARPPGWRTWLTRRRPCRRAPRMRRSSSGRASPCGTRGAACQRTSSGACSAPSRRLGARPERSPAAPAWAWRCAAP
jgi:hypothetical protein